MTTIQRLRTGQRVITTRAITEAMLGNDGGEDYPLEAIAIPKGAHGRVSYLLNDEDEPLKVNVRWDTPQAGSESWCVHPKWLALERRLR